MAKTQHQKQERIGEIYLYFYVTSAGLLPILINYGAKIMPPLLYASLVNIAAAAAFFLYLFFTNQLAKIAGKKLMLLNIGITFFNIVIPFILIFIGTRQTSAINTALLHQTELFFTFLACGLFFGEVITRQKLVGGFIILIGTMFVLYNGAFKFNYGDIFVIASTVLYPFGNRYLKMALTLATPSVIIFLRSALGGAVLLLVSVLFEQYSGATALTVRTYLPLILLNGIGMLGISKILWLEGLKRLDISKSIAIAISAPAGSVVFAMIFLKEIPTVYQLAGLITIVAGLYILTRQKTQAPMVEIN